MAKASYLSSAKNIHPFLSPVYPARLKSSFLQINKVIRASSNDEVPPLVKKKAPKFPRTRIRIPANGGSSSYEYNFSLRDLELEDLAADGRYDTMVYINLDLQKHVGFGTSVKGRVVASISRICPSCASPFSKKIDAIIRVWLLREGRGDPSKGMPVIGSEDPSVIYVRPGSEADLGTVIQDEIRLQMTIKEMCSEICENSEAEVDYFVSEGKKPSHFKRWSKLQQLKKSPSDTS